jgi:hypothetical protein
MKRVFVERRLKLTMTKVCFIEFSGIVLLIGEVLPNYWNRRVHRINSVHPAHSLIIVQLSHPIIDGPLSMRNLRFTGDHINPRKRLEPTPSSF